MITPTISNVTIGGTIPKGKTRIEFILTTDFVGTIGGAVFNGTETTGVPGISVYPIEAPNGNALAAIVYTISAGGATLTTF